MNQKKEPEKYFAVNVDGSQNIFKFAKELELKVVFASSASVYGEVKKLPIKENAEKYPLSTYGKTKLECEKKAQKYTSQGAKIIGLRYFNVYGEGQSKEYAGVITNFLDQIKIGQNISIHGDGKQTRDFVNVLDVVKANFKAMTEPLDRGFFNIASGKSISISKLAKMMLKIAKSELEIEYHKKKDFGIKHSLADVSLASKKLDWRYEIELEDWLEHELTNKIDHH